MIFLFVAALTNGDIHRIFKLGLGAVVGIIFTIATCCICCIVVACVCRRRRKYRGHVQRQPNATRSGEQAPLQPPAPVPQPSPQPQPAQPVPAPVLPYTGKLCLLNENELIRKVYNISLGKN